MTSISGSPSILRPLSTSAVESRVRLICAAHAGGGASVFASWGRDQRLEGVEIFGLTLSGHEERIHEVPRYDLRELAFAVVQAIEELEPLPLVLFGHSFGALLVHEIGVQLTAQGKPPVHVIVATQTAPHHLREPTPLSGLPTLAMINALAERYSGFDDQVMSSSELLALTTPGLRADLAMAETYMASSLQKVACSVTVLGARRDIISDDGLAAWGEIYDNQASVAYLESGHFVMRDCPAEVLGYVVNVVQKAINLTAYMASGTSFENKNTEETRFNMNTNMTAPIAGIWMPLITPFYQGALDEISLKKLIEHYNNTPIAGYVLAGTTGESMTLSDEETRRVVEVAQSVNGKQLPIILGLTGSDTKELAAKINEVERWPVAGYLISTPYYTRPSQEGIYKHFEALADATKRPIIIYNIPYRTGVNIENATMLRLAKLPNIKGVKDCCASSSQTAELLRKRPKGFSVLVGDDAEFFSSVSLGAEGGILASAHIDPAVFTQVLKHLSEDKAGSLIAARAEWNSFVETIPLVFGEPNPAPLKYILSQRGIIRSQELRLPMMPVSPAMQARLDAYMDKGPLRPGSALLSRVKIHDLT